MAETPLITPASPSAPTSNTPITPVSPSAAAPQTTLTEVPVGQAPASLTQPTIPAAPIDGRVISSNPQAQLIRIQTAAGEIDIQSSAQLPPDTPVSVQLYTERNQTLANIVVLSQAAIESRQVEKIAQPTPTLQEGQPVPAILLPEEPAPQIQARSPSLPQPMDTSTPRTVITSGSIPSTPEPTEPLQRPQQEDLSISTTTPLPQKDPLQSNSIQRVLSAYLPQILGGKPHVAATLESSVPDTLDNNLMQIARAQMYAKTAQQTMQSPPPRPDARTATQPPSPVQNVLNTLLSAIENIKSPQTPFPATSFQQADLPLPKNMYQLTIIKIFPPDTPSQQIKTMLQKATMTTPQALEAKIETITPSGFPILKTAGGRFVIKTPVDISVGSTVIFAAVPMTPDQIIASSQPQAMNTPLTQLGTAPAQGLDPLLSTTWPALHEALQVIQQSDPAAAQMLRHTLPTPTHNLAPTALLFLAALRQGTVENWLGSTILQALQAAGKQDLAARLDSDFGKISRQSKELLTDEWRAISIPLLHDEHISQMQFYVRRQYDQNNDSRDREKKPATRFILNMQLSRMGPLQLDGFIQKKSFDIVLRSEEKLPFEMRQELMKRFARGLDQVHMQGGISFQGKQQGWVNINLPQQSGMMA
ncbi:MAG: hypothetical protein HY052_03980 [Proteobacteria bacterium]|nr:hypothetical protein [Pseudomonadota bacterium]